MDSAESAVELSADAVTKLLGMGERRVAKANIEIECAEVWRQISNYLDDEVDPMLRATMSSHFKDCAHCSAVLDGARNVVKLVGDGRAFEIPAGASQRFYKKLNDHLRLANACGVEPPERGTD
jgi:hypothetical protein